jgi:hypothetical protein
MLTRLQRPAAAAPPAAAAAAQSSAAAAHAVASAGLGSDRGGGLLVDAGRRRRELVGRVRPAGGQRVRVLEDAAEEFLEVGRRPLDAEQVGLVEAARLELDHEVGVKGEPRHRGIGTALHQPLSKRERHLHPPEVKRRVERAPARGLGKARVVTVPPQRAARHIAASSAN